MAADTDTTTEAAPPAHDGDTGQRLTAVERAVDRIEQAISRIVPSSHTEAQQREENRLDRPTDVAEQVRAELQRARDEDAAQQAADAEKADAESVKERLARLEETPPAPPRLRRTRLLGWGDGRG